MLVTQLQVASTCPRPTVCIFRNSVFLSFTFYVILVTVFGRSLRRRAFGEDRGIMTDLGKAFDKATFDIYGRAAAEIG